MNVYNWSSWQSCKDYFTCIYPPSLPPGLPQGKTYHMSQLSAFFLHWKEHKRLCQKALDDLNAEVHPHNTVAHSKNYQKVLKENDIPDFFDNLNKFLEEFNYTIYV